MKIMHKILIVFLVLMTVFCISSISAADNTNDIVSTDYEDTVVSDGGIVGREPLPSNNGGIDPDSIDEGLENEISETNEDTLTFVSANHTTVNTEHTFEIELNGDSREEYGRLILEIWKSDEKITETGIPSTEIPYDFKFTYTFENAGSYTIRAEYITQHGEVLEQNQSFTVEDSPTPTPTTTTITSDASSKVDNPTTISANVDAGGLSVNNGTATITITKEGSTVHTDTQNVTAAGVSFEWTPQAVGIYNINVKYNGYGDTYAPSEANQTYNVTKISTTTNITSGERAKKGNVTTTIKILDENGNPVTKGQINFTATITGTQFKYSELKNITGNETAFIWEAPTANTYSLQVEFIPDLDAPYVPSSTTGTLIVSEKEPTNTTITMPSHPTVGNITITGKVRDKDGKVVADGKVNITIMNGKEFIWSDEKNLSTVGEVSFIFEAKYAPRSYQVTMKYIPLFDSEYEGSEAVQTLYIDETEPTNTTITSPTHVLVNNKINTTATILDKDGKAITNGLVNFTATKNGQVIFTEQKAITDEISFEWTPDTATTYILTVRFIPEFSTKYQASEGTQTLYVAGEPEPTITNITSNNRTKTGKITTTGVITDQHGQAITHGKVIFTVIDEEGQEIYSNTTNTPATGIKFIYTINEAGTYYITLKFEPMLGSSYNTSEATQTLYVTEPIPTTTNITSDNSCEVEQTFTTTATIVDKDGNPVNAGIVNFIVNKDGKVVYSKNLNIPNNEIKFDWKPTEEGVYILNMKYTPSMGSAYEASEANQTFNVKPNSELKLIVKNINMYYADGTKLVIKAVDGLGKSKANLKINVKVHGKNIKLTTNKNGIAQVAIKLKPNTYKVQTTAKNMLKNGTLVETNSKITVKKWKKSLTNLKVKDFYKVYHTPKRFTVTLKHEKIPIAGQYIKIKVSNYVYYIKTNNKGIASLGINFKPGVWNAKVSINIAGVSITKNAKIVVKRE
jgi:protocatechuate 3,4-dioxygenase beta subunit